MAEDRIAQHVAREIETLHAFLEGWLSGSAPGTDEAFAAGLESRLHPAFVNIQPAGVLLPRGVLLEQIRRGYGASPQFRIRIRNVALHHGPGDGGVVLATYEEYQKGARNSARAENARLSTVLFQWLDGDRPVWRHIHETWLPDAKHDPANFRF